MQTLSKPAPQTQTYARQSTRMQPLRFHPIIKRAVWGGQRLGNEFRKPIGDGVDCAESWEVSDLPGSESLVQGGRFDGISLRQLMLTYREQLLGEHSKRERFPLLMKLLDAKHPLSVQVHPGSHLRETPSVKEPSKAELWVVLDAQPGNQMSIGLKAGVTRADLEAAVSSHSVAEYLNTFEAQPGECYFIPPGTVHSLGAGIVIAEVQQTCDITYRLDDWGRPGSDGQPRALHIEQALEAIDFTLGPVSPIVPQNDPTFGSAEALIDNQYFAARRFKGPTAMSLPQDNRAHVLTLLSGTARIETEYSTLMLRGDVILLPAERPLVQIELDVQAALLDCYLSENASDMLSY